MIHFSPIRKILFIGTPEFAVPSLEKLATSDYKPLLVITQPAKPQGRKLLPSPFPIKLAAQKLGIEVIEPESIRDDFVISKLEELEPDIIITVAYGGFLNKKILRLPEFGCLNVHPSLLPKYRGATPINHALFNGEKETGVTITKMTLKMDSGPILQQKRLTIEERDNYTTLSEKLAVIGAEQLINVIEQLENGQINPLEQENDQATYCYKLQKEDLIIHWSQEAVEVHNRVRGLAMEPGAVSFFRGKRIKILETEILEEESNTSPGTVTDIIKNRGIAVCCKGSRILLTKVQPAGKRIMTAYEYSIGARIERGEIFNSGISD